LSSLGDEGSPPTLAKDVLILRISLNFRQFLAKKNAAHAAALHFNTPFSANLRTGSRIEKGKRKILKSVLLSFGPKQMGQAHICAFQNGP
jgi:hypothetical protein